MIRQTLICIHQSEEKYIISTDAFVFVHYTLLRYLRRIDYLSSRVNERAVRDSKKEKGNDASTILYSNDY